MSETNKINKVIFSYDNLVSHADKIRTLTGVEETLSLAEMTQNISEANKEIDIQEILLAQIFSELDGKAIAGKITLPELINPANNSEVFFGKEYIDEEGQAQIGAFTIEEELNEQDLLLSQLREVLTNGKARALNNLQLPSLSNPANINEVFLGKEVLDSQGNIRVGTFSIEEEIVSINTIILQLQEIVNSLPDIEII